MIISIYKFFKNTKFISINFPLYYDMFYKKCRPPKKIFGRITCFIKKYLIKQTERQKVLFIFPSDMTQIDRCHGI